jgi:uncharacterized protein YbjQ (UPF0145 family)
MKGAKKMLMTTTDIIPGKQVHILGLVKGSVVRAKHMGRDIAAGFKSIVGGEIKGYTELMNEARSTATERMTAEARNMNADAIICVRYETASIMNIACEVMAYGTAVRFA